MIDFSFFRDTTTVAIWIKHMIIASNTPLWHAAATYIDTIYSSYLDEWPEWAKSLEESLEEKLQHFLTF